MFLNNLLCNLSVIVAKFINNLKCVENVDEIIQSNLILIISVNKIQESNGIKVGKGMPDRCRGRSNTP